MYTCNPARSSKFFLMSKVCSNSATLFPADDADADKSYNQINHQ